MLIFPFRVICLWSHRRTDSCLSLRFPFLFLIYPKSGVAGGVVRKGSTTTITLAAFMKQYPELKNLSHEQRAFQYKYYLLHMNGMSVDDLDAYYHTHDDGQQEGGGGGAGATNAFSCCKDDHDSSGCLCKYTPP